MRALRLLAIVGALATLAPGAARAATPPGPYGWVQRGYDLGRETLLVAANGSIPHALPARLAGELTVPLSAPGRRPVVVLLHGAHQSCELPGGLVPTQDWPCRPGFLDVPSFQGYRYLARLLASHGFVVLSIDGNPVAPADGSVLTFPDGTPFSARTFMDLRAKIVDAQLRRLWRAGRGETGDAFAFGTPLTGRIDARHVGLVGHSRGGEGVVWASLLPGPHPYHLDALVALAPVDFFRRTLPDLPFAVLLPYCDGDVYDLEGAWFYDDARSRGRKAPLWQAVIEGANHNFFNRVWEDEVGFFEPGGNVDVVDPCSSDRIGLTRLSRSDQEAVGTAVIVPFLRAFVGASAAGGVSPLLAPLGFAGPLPRTIGRAAVRISFAPPRSERLDVLRPESRADLRRNRLGGGVEGIRTDKLLVCLYDPGTIFGGGRYECGTRPPFQANALATYRVAWSRHGARLVTTLPGPTNVAGYAALTLRVAVDPTDERRNPPGAARPFSIVLRDADGLEAVVAVATSDPAVRAPRRGLAVLATIRIPVRAFVAIDRTRLSAVELRFDRAPRGRLLVTDLSFVR